MGERFLPHSRIPGVGIAFFLLGGRLEQSPSPIKLIPAQQHPPTQPCGAVQRSCRRCCVGGCCRCSSEHRDEGGVDGEDADFAVVGGGGEDLASSVSPIIGILRIDAKTSRVIMFMLSFYLNFLLSGDDPMMHMAGVGPEVARVGLMMMLGVNSIVRHAPIRCVKLRIGIFKGGSP